MVSLAQIEYILALKEFQNFQKAANKCYVTQPTLSMQIKKAEDQFGHQIFNRETTPLSLTAFGRTIIPNLHQIKDSYTALEIQLKKLEGTYKAEIKLGIIPTISGYLVPEFYEKWQQKLNAIKLEIVELKSEDLINELKDRKIDMGIMAGPLTEKGITSQVLYNEEIHIYAPHIKESRITINDLEQMRPWLLAEGNCLRTQMINFCNINDDYSKEWSYEGGNINILMEMVKKQKGYTLVPSNFISFTQQPKDHFHKIEKHNPARQIIAIYNERSNKEEYFLDLIREVQREKSKQSISIEQANLLPWR